MIPRKLMVFMILLVVLMLSAPVVSAHSNMDPFAYPDPDGALDPAGIARLVEDSGGAQVEIESATGAARFVRLQGGQIATLAARLGMRQSPAAQADAFFAEYGSIFGLQDRKAELTLGEIVTDTLGETHLTYRQVYQGVPVFAGTLRVHLDAENRVKVVNGAFVPGIALNATPSLSAAEAGSIAMQRVNVPLDGSRTPGVLDAIAIASTLYVYHDGLIRGVPGASHLVYEVEVSNGYDVREFVYVDAHNGVVVEQITGIRQELDRRIYSGTMGSLLWQEGDAYPWSGAATAADTAEINALITVTQHTYDFFFNTFGRDSYDGKGSTLSAIFADADIGCPNAHWTGIHIGFCRGMTADDVVAHEMGHAYTQYTDNLIYKWQPGALNESYSDIWGEVVDQINNFQTDTPNTPRTDDACSALGWDSQAWLRVSAPAGVAGDYAVSRAPYNPIFPAIVTGEVVLVNDGNDAHGSVTDACEPLVNSAEVAGRIAWVDFGNCDAITKTLNVQNAGAIGVIIVRHVGKSSFAQARDSNIVIPTVYLGSEDEEILRPALPDTLSATIDVSGAGTDDSVLWLTGEDATGFGGAIRDMWRPSCFDDPDRVGDANYWCAAGDSGGVHTNSGVPNHAFALLTDGGAYNGQTVDGIGLLKAAHIYWRAQTVYQIEASDFADHATALEQSCQDLTGTNLTGFDGNPSGEAITRSDCNSVVAAATAVELRTPPSCNFSPLLNPETPPVCSNPGELPIYSETFDTAPAGWALSNVGVYAGYTERDWEWVAVMPVTTSVPATRTGGFYAFDYLTYGNCRVGIPGDQSGVMYLDTPTLTVPSGVGDERLVFTFDHYVATLPPYDGGNVWISVNDGEWALVTPDAFIFNPYNTKLFSSTNPLHGTPAFGGYDQGGFKGSWGQSQVDLNGYAVSGDRVRLRFAFGVDSCNGMDGWYLDRVDAYYCTTPAADMVLAPASLESEQADDVLVTLPWTINNVSNNAVLKWMLPGIVPVCAQAKEDDHGALSGFFSDFSGGIYHADDFSLAFDTTLTYIGTTWFVYGAGLTPAQTIDWYIYPDVNGYPAGHPEDGGGTAVWHYTSTGGGAGVNVADGVIGLNLAAAGEYLTLPPGVYWLVVYPTYNTEVQQLYWHNGVDHGAEGKLIDPKGVLGGAGFTEWRPQSDYFAWHDLAFTVEGTSECTPPSWLSVSSDQGSVDYESSHVLGVGFDSTGVADGVYTHTLCVTSNDPAEMIVFVPVTLTVSTAPLATVELVNTVSPPYYPDTLITWTVALLPLNALHPYTYTVNDGLPLATSDSTLVFTRTGDPVGVHAIDFAVWNPVMSEPLTKTWQYEIVAWSAQEHVVYLPLVLR